MTKMNPEIKELWCNALESGKYKQTKGALRDNKGKGFCCLGVLTDLYHKATGDGHWDGSSFHHDDGDRSAGTPSDAVAEWAGFGGGVTVDNNPEVVIAGLRKSVAEFNDGDGVRKAFSFKEISAAIRECL